MTEKEAKLNAAYVHVAEGENHAWNPITEGPICDSKDAVSLSYDPREVECERCQTLIKEAWHEAGFGRWKKEKYGKQADD